MSLKYMLATMNRIVNVKLMDINGTSLTISSLLIFLLIFILLMLLSSILTRIIDAKLLTRLRIDIGLQYALRRMIRYTLVIVSAIFSFQFIGIDFTGLAVIFGFLSVGIGFGLRNITSNFVSGLILLIERPIKVGDRITVGDTEGEIQSINMRATTVQTVDDITIIVPNSQLIESQVTNWSFGNRRRRVRIPVGVSYNSDLDAVIQAMLAVANENEKVLEDPPPVVRFVEFGDSAWNLFLGVWIADNRDYYVVKSAINCAIVHKFREHNIEIPFPQRDVNFRNPIPAAD